MTSSSSSSPAVSDEKKAELEEAIRAKGDEIRALKESGAEKSAIGLLVEELLSLKKELDPTMVTKPKKKQQQQQPKKKQQQQKQQQQKQQKQSAASADDEESDYITARSENYSKWYNDIIRVTGLAESSPVRGCMIIKPWGMSLWDMIRTDLDRRIKLHGAENAYFPLLIPKSFLSKEAEHVDGFAKECAVVTHHRLTANEDNTELIADPEAELEEPLIIRPTSETVIWNTFKRWIKSYRDLPLKVNQWANVMRWELRTRPFLRTSEFLWQEGHTAHADKEGALKDARDMMDHYAALCEELLALPVVKGVKSPSERFAGADETFTIEALMQNGWALQSGTSHFLGQNFGKAFDVTFQDDTGKQSDVWGTSWGVSTRLIGALIMMHSDDAGLVLPPSVAPIQVVIVPIFPNKKNDVDGRQAIEKAVQDLSDSLTSSHNIRVKVDDRDYIRNGAKYFEWERKGVPLRVEIGPRDVQNNVCVFKYRVGEDSTEKQTVNLANAADTAKEGLDALQAYLLSQATQRLEDGITEGATYEEMKVALETDEAGVFPGKGLFLVPWKCDADNENTIKQECKATIRCYPLDANEANMAKGKKCFYSNEDATHMALFGRAF